jgi:electron-transferring-flavoprotein dehydrogenase
MSERESMELDVLFVGAGVANLTAALHLKRSIDRENARAKAEGRPVVDEPVMMVIDKGGEVGNHTLSGAVVDPTAIRELFPELQDSDFPFISPVTGDRMMNLMGTNAFQMPGFMLPPAMHNTGCYLASVGEVTRWLAKKCEEAGIDVYSEFAANELIRDGNRIMGAKIADKGLDKEGHPTSAHAPGMDIQAQVTVIGEGTRGFLAQQLIRDFGLDSDSNPQIWSVGVKELIEIPTGRIAKGNVIHTMGYPLNNQGFGGGFIYGLEDNLIAIGLVFGLDYHNAMFDTHGLFLQYKKHPFVADLIAGGKVVEYGAKTIPEGGYFALPRVAVDGAVLVGDSAGFVNAMRLKGIHLAMKSGMLAAERILKCLMTGDVAAAKLDYAQDFESSWAGAEMRRSRNFRQPYHKGMLFGMAMTGLQVVTGGAFPNNRFTTPPDNETMSPASQGRPVEKTPTDDALYLDILSDVYKSGALHREDQKAHCEILDPAKCAECYVKYKSPCTRFCPAKVYEEELDEAGKFKGIQVSFSNCVHCKTCEIKDPMKNLKWNPPEGGDGPKYQRM